MLGGIYTRDRCPICRAVLNRVVSDGIVCKEHPEIRASHFIAKFRKTWRNFLEFRAAERFLTGLRFKADEGSYDARDYQRDNPLGFQTLMEQWYRDKTVESVTRDGRVERKIKASTRKNYKHYKEVMIAYFGNRNIKDIAENEAFIEDFFNTLTSVGNKTKWNYRSALNDFFTWVWRREKKSFAKAGISRPDLPEISFTLGYRKLVSKETQYKIVEEVRRITQHNPKIYLGIKWLCTYVNVRPSELISLKEGDINLGTGHFFFPDPKEGEWKAVPLIAGDVEILKTFPLAVPSMPFFRHVSGISGVAENRPFGLRYLYKWWIKACENIGIEGVDLYGGTRHSTVTALKGKYSPEEIRRLGTGHKTNKAFDRYLSMGGDESRELYADAAPSMVATVSQPVKLRAGGVKLLKLR